MKRKAIIAAVIASLSAGGIRLVDALIDRAVSAVTVKAADNDSFNQAIIADLLDRVIELEKQARAK